jgi:hypothetical protein
LIKGVNKLLIVLPSHGDRHERVLQASKGLNVTCAQLQKNADKGFSVILSIIGTISI